MAGLRKQKLDDPLQSRVKVRRNESDVDESYDSSSGDSELGSEVGRKDRTSASSEDYSEDDERVPRKSHLSHEE